MSGTPNVPVLAALIFYQVVLAAMCTGPLGAFLVEAFPTKVRYTGVSFVHHTGTGWFGGFLPLVATALVARTGNPYAGLWYPIVISAIVFCVGLVLVREPDARDEVRDGVRDGARVGAAVSAPVP